MQLEAMVAIAAVHLAGPAVAGGGLDPSFGNHGLAVIDADGMESANDDFARRMHVAADGEIVVVGTSQGEVVQAAGSTIAIMGRLTPDGQLDTTFGNAGFASVSPAPARLYAVASHGDGYVVGGEALDRSAVWRFTGDGIADAAFGAGGTGTVLLWDGTVTMLATLASGGIAIAGLSAGGSDAGFSVAKLSASGDLDADFGNGGIVKLTLPRIEAMYGADAMAATADERLILSGGTGPRLEVFRLLPGGEIDEAFGEGGFASLAIGLGDEIVFASDLLVRDDGRVFVSGFVGTDPWFLWPGRGFVASFNADGSLDTTFAGGGVYETDPAAISDLAAIAPGRDGAVFAVGTRTTDPAGGGWTGETVVLGLDAGGKPLEQFGDDGVFHIGTRWYDGVDDAYAVDIAAQGDDGFAILADGWSSERWITLARVGTAEYPGMIGFPRGAMNIAADGAIVEVELFRWGGSSGAVAVDVAIGADSSATEHEDFELLDSAVNWADGESGARPIRLRIVDDGALGEHEETIVLDFQIVGGTAAAAVNRTVLSLAQDDGQPGPPVATTVAPAGGGAVSAVLLLALLMARRVSEVAIRGADKRSRHAGRAGIRR